ncbi:hypothetical protein PHLCEN_2v13393 [Hermanssonia centrifuga]|uniref:Uncharacterized protein n=1 Tax=Hermanssonia centrifuga TaxID=98765 RepID=A0A2R6NEB2_9APHY|nr:hypothetical protein PHLCEN_2v13393 [Hermanssonia centrifuga]
MIANDLFSYAQEKSVNNDGKNIVRILQEQEKLSYIQAVDRVKLIMREKEQEYMSAAICCLEDHELGKDSDVRRWIAALPYVMTGNVMWSQQTARYKVKSMPEGILFPSITYPMEEMPADGAGEDNAIRINE